MAVSDIIKLLGLCAVLERGMPFFAFCFGYIFARGMVRVRGRVSPVQKQAAHEHRADLHLHPIPSSGNKRRGLVDRSEDLQIFGSKNLRIGRRLSCPFQS